MRPTLSVNIDSSELDDMMDEEAYQKYISSLS